jgi:hypothetical protein
MDGTGDLAALLHLGASRTSTMSAWPSAIIWRAFSAEILGTTALAASSIFLTLVVVFLPCICATMRSTYNFYTHASAFSIG